MLWYGAGMLLAVRDYPPKNNIYLFYEYIVLYAHEYNISKKKWKNIKQKLVYMKVSYLNMYNLCYALNSHD